MQVQQLAGSRLGWVGSGVLLGFSFLFLSGEVGTNGIFRGALSVSLFVRFFIYYYGEKNMLQLEPDGFEFLGETREK